MKKLLLIAGAAAIAFGTPAVAKPDNHGGHGKSQAGKSHGRHVVTMRTGGRLYALDSRGNCPPGLAKKNNGCLPPGQAKKAWAVGQPLPASVYYEPLPPALLGRLTPAPAGYQYVRVASDILMLAVGTRMITAAIADLGRF